MTEAITSEPQPKVGAQAEKAYGRTNKKHLKLISFFLCVLCGCFFITACTKEKPKQGKPVTVPVMTAAAVQKDIPVQLKAIGNVEAYSVVSVNSRVGGQIQRIHFREGQDAAKGALLFTIDPRPFEAALKQAEANLAKDKAQYENALQQARRYEDLAKKGYVSLSDYDQVRTNAEALAGTVNAGKAAVEHAHLQLTYCYIHSPISGRTGGLLLNEGNMIKADDKPIVTINQIQPIYVNFSVPEQHLSEIKKFMSAGKLKVMASIPENNGYEAQGELTFIENAVDRTTGTIRMKGTFANKDRRLWPGQFVNVVLRLTTQPRAVVVPTPAVQTGQKGPFVFVIKEDSTAEPRDVVVSRTFEDESVIASGLNPGEKVVTDGQLRLVPGAKVEIKK